MKQNILIPDLGEYEKVDVVEVMVSIGDSVTEGAPMLSLETDKAVMDIPAPFSGVIESFTVQVGDQVSKDDLIGVMVVSTAQAGDQDAPASAPTPSTESTEQQTESRPFKVMPGHAGPKTRRFARELGADLMSVTGSGRKGRILEQDVKQFVHQQLTRSSQPALEIDPPKLDFQKFGETENIPLSRIQKLSSKHLHRNWVSIPHVTHFEQADLTELEAYRQANKKSVEKKGVRLTMLAFIMKAVVDTLKDFPNFNASFDPENEQLILKKYCNIGFAADTPNGLVVPVIHQADQKTVLALAQDLVELSSLARAGKLKASQMQGGCFTISSLGGIGGSAFTPIIHAPEVAILGVSQSKIQAVYREGQFEPRLILPLSLSYDHRVIDGAMAARMAKDLAEKLTDVDRFKL